jgi:hypothetical protein
VAAETEGQHRQRQEADVHRTKLPAGVDLDAEFARKALGWETFQGRYDEGAWWCRRGEDCDWIDIPDFRDNRNLGLIAEASSRDRPIEISLTWLYHGSVHCCMKSGDRSSCGTGRSEAEARRNAILKWLGVEW